MKPLISWKRTLTPTQRAEFVCALVLVAICVAIWFLSNVVVPAVRP